MNSGIVPKGLAHCYLYILISIFMGYAKLLVHLIDRISASERGPDAYK